MDDRSMLTPGPHTRPANCVVDRCSKRWRDREVEGGSLPSPHTILTTWTHKVTSGVIDRCMSWRRE